MYAGEYKGNFNENKEYQQIILPVELGKNYQQTGSTNPEIQSSWMRTWVRHKTVTFKLRINKNACHAT